MSEVYVGPILHDPAMCQCWCARCDQPDRIISELQRAWKDETRDSDVAAGYRSGLLTAQNIVRRLIGEEGKP